MNKKDIILKNALEIFNENGYVGTSINDVAKKSGIAKSTIFHYFENKEDLFNQVFVKSKIAFSKTNNPFLFGASNDELIELLEFQRNHIEELKFFNQFEYSKYISDDSKKLAQEMGIHYHYLQQILVGERRPPERIKEIENFLNIDLKEEK